jgi:hypothetical protein
MPYSPAEIRCRHRYYHLHQTIPDWQSIKYLCTSPNKTNRLTRCDGISRQSHHPSICNILGSTLDYSCDTRLMASIYRITIFKDGHFNFAIKSISQNIDYSLNEVISHFSRSSFNTP